MKKHTWMLLGIIILLCAIFLFPWFELLLFTILLLFGWSYYHYWKPKAHYGPYLYYGLNPANSMWINFVLVSSKELALESAYFCEISKNRSFDGDSVLHLSPHSIIEEKDRLYLHFFAENLNANTQYFYRIGHHKQIVEGGRQFHFTTGPTPESISKSTARFIIYGDDQTADWFPILAQLTNHYQYTARPEFIVHLGDINQNLWHDAENNVFFQSKQKIFRQIPYLPVVGNHDAKPICRYNAIYTLPHWYHIDYGRKIRIICLSGYDGFVPQTNGQYEFLKAQLETAFLENRFIIVCVHEIFFSIETNIPEETPTVELREFVIPLLHQYNRGFQRNILIFSGHVHEYCRIVRDDLTYIIEGACSNAKWYSTLQNSASHTYNPEIATKEYGAQSFALLTLQKDSLIVEIRGWGKKIIEKLEFRL